jgi:M6 family metalloprotease-like protein
MKSLFAVLLFAPLVTLYAINASPVAFDAEQPDGTPLTLHICGDEYYHYETDARGFTLIDDAGWRVYARRDGNTGRLISTGLRAGIDDPRRGGLVPHIKASIEARRAQRAAVDGLAEGEEDHGHDDIVSASAAAGTLPNLVVLIRWSDHATRPLPTQGNIDVLMNNAGPDANYAPTGSVRDVYLENSYGQLILNSTIAYWVTSNNTESYYANGNSGLTSRIHSALIHALNVLDADPNINFSDYDQDGDGQIDAITFLHSGYGAEWGGNDCFGANYADRIWSHKWGISGGWTSSDGVRVTSYHISPAVWGTCGSTIGRIGVIAHETGHFLGLPDLYDTDSSGGSGIGSYGLMANSWGFDGSQKYPPHFCAWSKIQLGWLSPTVIAPGSHSLPQVQTNASVYRIDQGFPSGEYLLIENRQSVGFDSAMPQGGLAIWHIDDTTGYNTEGYPAQTNWPSNGNHYRVALLQADGGYDLERGADRGDAGDVWHSGAELGPSNDPNTGPFPNTDAYQSGVLIQTNNRISNISSSGATMTFSYQVDGTPTEPPVAPGSLAAVTLNFERIDISWQDNADSENGFRVERASDGVSFSEIATLPADSTAYSDNGLTPNTTYSYRVRAFNAVGNSAYSNTAAATTDPPPPPPAAPSGLGAVAASDAAIDLAWADNSSDEDAFDLYRSIDEVDWTLVTSLAANTTSFQDSGLSAETRYYYQVLARNSWGSSPSNVANATTDAPPAFVDHHADLDIAVSGGVSGTFSDTWDADGNVQTLSERESGGRKSRRHSFLEHQWRFSNVRGGLLITLVANAWAPANGDSDDFDLQTSDDGGQSWTTVLRVANGSSPGTVSTGALPGSNPGTIYVRAVDSDRSQGNRSLDSLHIDQLILRTDLDPNDFPPDPPAGLTASALSASSVQLAWIDNATNERGYRVQRSNDGFTFSNLANLPIDASSYIDDSATPNATFWYKVIAFTASYEAESNLASATTPDGISLAATGSKRKGRVTVDLSWQGGSSTSTVVIWRSVNGGAFEATATVANTGSYSDATGLRGGPTIAYVICDPSGSLCSNTVQLSF